MNAEGRLDSEAAAAIGPLLGDPLAAGDAVAALRRYSLITLAGDGLVLVHRLVHAVTRAQLTPETAAQWEQAAALVEAAIPAEPVLPAAWPTCAALLPHARAVLDLNSDAMRQIARYLGFSGSDPAAVDLCQIIADAYTASDAYGPEHPDTLTARRNLAYWMGKVAD